ncbi:MAG TPA: RDD family protein [Casimicrobiaceae bacterium]|nr:RDD family protein [Casimicrobiaceae bacterium]
MGEGAGGPAPASLARRLASLVYELLIVAAIVLVGGFALTPLMSPLADPNHALLLPPPGVRLAGFALLAALLAAYCAYGWSRGRRTLPMKTWRLLLVDAEGVPVTPKRALARYAAAWIAPLVAIAAYAATHSPLAAAALALNHAWALVDPERRFLHDRLAGTRLVTDAPHVRA